MSPQRKSIGKLILVFLIVGILFFIYFRNLGRQLTEPGENVKTERVEK